MKPDKKVPQPEETVEKKTMSRGKAIKKSAGIALAAGTMLTLLNSKQALAASGETPGNFTTSGSSTKNYNANEW